MVKWIDVLVFGSANIEYITYVTKLPKVGERVEGMYMETSFGGEGANQCVAAAKLGSTVALIAKLGKDVAGDDYLNYLSQQGVNVDNVEQLEDSATGMSEIAKSDDGESQIIVVPGANSLLNAKDVCRCKKVLKDAKVLLCQLEISLKGTLTAMRKFKGVSILNASPLANNWSDDLIKAPTILCINKDDAARLTSVDEIKTPEDAKEVANAFLKKGAQSVVITMGDQGAVYLSKKDKNTCKHVPAPEVRAVADPSGVGDAFVASLAHYIALFPDLPRENHISAANACAAFAIQHSGTHSSFPGQHNLEDDICTRQPIVNIISDKKKNPTTEEDVTNESEDVTVENSQEKLYKNNSNSNAEESNINETQKIKTKMAARTCSSGSKSTNFVTINNIY
ncbi:uncharacterized protein Dwil_GK14853 [Drosophila willistoni]|uniref:Ribokinase n=1 Tax=Drosophila willistoni TaxID=7260 RepID=B4MUG3_DROWI|nr:uncharacterized protein Dwil_GK14853 [Drosophila willistoni]